VPGVYGIPDAWPNIQALLADAGFDDEHGQIEVIFAGNPTRASASPLSLGLVAAGSDVPIELTTPSRRAPEDAMRMGGS